MPKGQTACCSFVGRCSFWAWLWPQTKLPRNIETFSKWCSGWPRAFWISMPCAKSMGCSCLWCAGSGPTSWSWSLPNRTIGWPEVAWLWKLQVSVWNPNSMPSNTLAFSCGKRLHPLWVWSSTLFVTTARPTKTMWEESALWGGQYQLAQFRGEWCKDTFWRRGRWWIDIRTNCVPKGHRYENARKSIHDQVPTPNTQTQTKSSIAMFLCIPQWFLCDTFCPNSNEPFWGKSSVMVLSRYKRLEQVCASSPVLNDLMVGQFFLSSVFFFCNGIFYWRRQKFLPRQGLGTNLWLQVFLGILLCCIL